MSGLRVYQMDLKFNAEMSGSRNAIRSVRSGCSRTRDRTLFPRRHQKSPTVSCLATETQSNKKMAFCLSTRASFGSRLFHPRGKLMIRTQGSTNLGPSQEY